MTQFRNSSELIRAALHALATELTATTNSDVVLRVSGELTDAQRVDLEPFRLETSSENLDNPQHRSTAIGVLYSVCYAKKDKHLRPLFADLAARCDSLVIVDQIDNASGTDGSQLLDLVDADGRPYQALCHPFQQLLETAGFAHVCVIPAPHPTKSLTGVVIASRAVAISVADIEGTVLPDPEPPPQEIVANPRWLDREPVARLRRDSDETAVHTIRAALAVLASQPGADGDAPPFVETHGDLSEAQRQELAPFLNARSSVPSGATQEPARKIAVLWSVCYAKTEEDVWTLLSELATTCDTLLIADQIDNVDGTASEVLELADADGRPYEAMCHPFGRILRAAGFPYDCAIRVKQPAKSLTGIVIASRLQPVPVDQLEAWTPASVVSAELPLPPYSERVARLQRVGDDQYLWDYWNASAQDRFVRLAGIVGELIQSSAAADDVPFSVLDFGCSSGPFFRRLRGDLGAHASLRLIGVDVDRRALQFLRARMPEVETVEADVPRFGRMGFADTGQVDVCVSTSVLLLLPPDELLHVLEDLGRLASAIVIVDQIENVEGERAEVQRLTDFKGVEYDAVCHPFATILRSMGFDDISITPVQHVVKGATGVIVARRSPSPPAPGPEYAAYVDRVARLQRPGGEHLQDYWNAYSQRRFTEVCAAVAALIGPRASSVSLFDFACSAGPLFRALHAHLGDRLELVLAGADADQQAVAFVSARLPGVLAFEADPLRLRELGFANSEHFDICTATSVCYALDEDTVRLLLEDLGMLADLLIIGDQIENVDGPQAETKRLIDVHGMEYDAYCHPFRSILHDLGFPFVQVLPISEPVKSVSGLIVASRSELPSGLAEEFARRTTYENFAATLAAEPSISVTGARAAFDACDDQVEQLPRDVAIAEGELYGGPELVGDRGIKLAGVVPRGGSVHFEVEVGADVMVSDAISWDRPHVDIDHHRFADADVFAQHTSPPDEDWQPDQWGSWGDLRVDHDVLRVDLPHDMDVDANQVDGMGPLDLLLYVHPQADLRDAIVELELRGRGFDAGDAEVFLWFQNLMLTPRFNQRYGAALSGVGSVSANYALTSQPLTAHLADGEWHGIRLQLANDPALWSFAGNAFADRQNAVRYSYLNLNEALAEAWNLHILACYPREVPNFQNKRDLTRFGRRPSGALEMRRCRILAGADEAGPRFGNVDFLLEPQQRAGRYRTVSTSADGVANRGAWQAFTLPDTRRPVVSRLAVNPAGNAVSGRVNAMGYRTWCWIEHATAPLYLGATKHSRDFSLALPAPVTGGERLIVANQRGGVRFTLARVVQL